MAWHNGTQIPRILADTVKEAAKTNTTSGYQRHQRYQRSTAKHIFSIYPKNAICSDTVGQLLVSCPNAQLASSCAT
ncbi:MAG: hypothetical protein D6755_12405, partial [Anaerolineae bacterium]